MGGNKKNHKTYKVTIKNYIADKFKIEDFLLILLY